MKALKKLDRAVCQLIDSPLTRKIVAIVGITIIAATYASGYWWL